MAPAALPTAVAFSVSASMVIPAVAVPLPVPVAALVTALAIAVLSPVLRAGPAAVAPLDPYHRGCASLYDRPPLRLPWPLFRSILQLADPSPPVVCQATHTFEHG